MQPSVALDEVLTGLAASLGRSGWLVTVASLLAVFAAGAAVRAARRMTRRSTPELVVLLNQSAAFYGRWPGDRLADAPRAEVLTEANRCRRTIELLESRAAIAGEHGPASRGAVDGLRVWIALLSKRIDECTDVPSGPAYA